MSVPIAFVAASTDDAQAALRTLSRRYDHVPPADASVVVVLGGDGMMLNALSQWGPMGKRIYGMNRGTVGFLMNRYREEGLGARLDAAQPAVIHPLRMDAVTAAGARHTGLAINEVSLLRQTRMTASIRILVDGRERLAALSCDGVLVSTPAGSTAYNLSAQGPILPLGTPLLALTPICPFRPRRWRGALLPEPAKVTFDVLESEKRPVSASASELEVRHVRQVTVTADRSTELTLLFDPEHHLEERILAEQFIP